MGDDRRRRSLRDSLDDLGVERSSAPDVEVYRLTDTDPPRGAPERLPSTEELPPEEAGAGHHAGGVGSSRWLDEVRTSIWEDSQKVAPEPPIKRRITARMPSAAKPAPAPSPVAEPAVIVPPQARVAQPVASVHVGRALVTTRPPIDVDEDPDDRPRPSTRPPLQIESPVRIKVRTLEQVSPDPRLWVLTEPGSAGAEQYRVLSLKLREGQDARVVAVVAPNAQAQGYVAASNVALALGEGRRCKVLLLDANLRHPEIGGLFGLTAAAGLGQQLRHHRRSVDDPWEVLAVNASMHLLPAEPAEPNPSALLGSEAFSDLVGEARRFFDYVVISAPPVMDSADTHILQEQIDGAVLVVRARVTRRDSISASVSRLGAAKFLGVVLVGT